MVPCRACGQTIGRRDAFCYVCGAARQSGYPPAKFSRRNEVISVIGVFLAVVLLGVCLSPLLIIATYFIFLVLPPYLGVVLVCAIAAAQRAYRLCRASGGRIPAGAYAGYFMVLLAVIAALAVRTHLQQDEAQKLQAARQQFGPLFYPGAQLDPNYSAAIRTHASVSEVTRFYRENSLCDSRRSYGGGGDYAIPCSSKSQPRFWIRIYSRVDQNEPYILIRMEP